MEPIGTIIQVFMSKLDIKDAYYSIPISKSDQKYLKFFLYKYIHCCITKWVYRRPKKIHQTSKTPLSEL